jgi:hypothetical protein
LVELLHVFVFSKSNRPTKGVGYHPEAELPIRQGGAAAPATAGVDLHLMWSFFGGRSSDLEIEGSWLRCLPVRSPLDGG